MYNTEIGILLGIIKTKNNYSFTRNLIYGNSIILKILTLRGGFFQIGDYIISFIYFLNTSEHHFGTWYIFLWIF